MIHQPPLGLYVHIPWCPSRCVYCDFNTYIDAEPELKHRYHAALLHEIRESGAALGQPVLDTVFFGGGTPTTLTPDQFAELIGAVRSSFALRPNAEISSEANPGTLSRTYVRALLEAGVNRLSIGVQSFLEDELNFLSRLHSAAAARQAVADARAAGFRNISLDLIFNLPQQELPAWRFNLKEALALEPDHFSIYSLIIEPGTPLQRQVAQGVVPVPDDDLAAEMYEATINTLGAAGYCHYEISNWARSGAEADWESPRLASAHNLIYWRNQPYLGVGAGAYGTVDGHRWANLKRPQDYIERIEWGGGRGAARDERTYEKIGRETAISEQLMLGLRLVREGVSAAEFAGRFGFELESQFGEAITWGQHHNLLEWVGTGSDCRLRLTRAGCTLANQVILNFL
jgi:oxygen-independent coproporphyrinogen-3 oxidase